MPIARTRARERCGSPKSFARGRRANARAGTRVCRARPLCAKIDWVEAGKAYTFPVCTSNAREQLRGQSKKSAFCSDPERLDSSRMNAPEYTAATARALFPAQPQALLALADGTVFRGRATGAFGYATGEVVFNTAMTGYQEILTDPSYAQQIVTLTYPHIGNVGVNAEDAEAPKVYAAGLVIKDLPLRMSNFRAETTLAHYLEREGTVAIADIDTRRLPHPLRTKGAQNGRIMGLAARPALTQERGDEAIALARRTPSMAGLDLAKVVSVREPYEWTETVWKLGEGHGTLKEPRHHVV